MHRTFQGVKTSMVIIASLATASLKLDFPVGTGVTLVGCLLVKRQTAYAQKSKGRHSMDIPPDSYYLVHHRIDDAEGNPVWRGVNRGNGLGASDLDRLRAPSQGVGDLLRQGKRVVIMKVTYHDEYVPLDWDVVQEIKAWENMR
jgi:hypothetical protein